MSPVVIFAFVGVKIFRTGTLVCFDSESSSDQITKLQITTYEVRHDVCFSLSQSGYVHFVWASNPVYYVLQFAADQGSCCGHDGLHSCWWLWHCCSSLFVIISCTPDIRLQCLVMKTLKHYLCQCISFFFFFKPIAPPPPPPPCCMSRGSHL